MTEMHSNQLYKFIVVFIILSSSLTAQINYNVLPSSISQANQYDVYNSIEMENESEKNYLLSAIEVVGLNLTVWSYSKYITQRGFADISWNSVKNNFKTGFVWDNDRFLMNQFMHPFHGANYFNSARSNGLSFWESIPYAIGGSLMWEMFMEKELPSYNDLANTSISGITLGEISNRIANLIIDESTIGAERVLREISSTIVNPMNGFNRLIRGEMWKVGNKKKNEKLHFTFAVGTHNVFINKNIDENEQYLSLRGNLDYGKQFDVKNHKNPFDYFTLQTEANFRNGSDILAISASGVITDSKLNLFDVSNNIFGVYKEIDIFYNDVYKFSSTSISSQLVNTTKLSPDLSLQNYLGLSIIIMGATNSAYANEVDKDYNLGPGMSGKLGISLKFEDNSSLYINYKRNWIHTLGGAESEEFIGLLNTGFNYNLIKNSSIGIEFLMYERFGDYKDFPNTNDSNSALRFYIKQII